MGKTIEVHNTSTGRKHTVEHVESFAHVGDDGELVVSYTDHTDDNFGWDYEVVGMW